MRYRNTKTGVVVDVTSSIKVGEWVAVEPPTTTEESKPAAKTPRKRKTKNE